ncbi:DUF6651 domain-containing protein [Methylobacterium sp. AMS5]|uniref:DUF6651 domain-containing protein n=1 Tax=Methylobacterium sp. AMS5 TaxID=925818 RepID=UPI00074FA713|nr:DUF6651 domain-containing protein [Methylobacterium sp. AMS5]AMB48271.1 hypothetical protein Y590_25220 [Methylobacterium sp. AMS5]
MNVTKTARSFPLHSIFTHPFGHSRPVFDKPNEGGAPEPKPEPKPQDPPAPEPKPGTSDADAKLLKENMKQKTQIETLTGQLKAWEGLDPEAVRKLVTDAAAAEDKRKADELALAEQRGDFDRVKAAMGEQHTKDLKAKDDLLGQKDTALAAALATIEELTVGASFLNSKFIADNLVLPPSVARREFGAHFETVNGVPVAYDKPKGASERTQLVDAQGKAVPFETAIAKLVEAHPDKERLLKGKLAPGGRSNTTDNTKVSDKIGDGELKGSARIAAILAARNGKKSA